MESIKHTIWQSEPVLATPSPVMALAANADGIWVGGTGGCAWQATDRIWHQRTASLPLQSVTALKYVDDTLIAGGPNGLAYSDDGGSTWQKSALDERLASITALAASSNYTDNKTLLAATLESGILHSSDGGKSWLSVNFGLQSLEINDLLWLQDEIVIAATMDGLHRSANGGRAWHSIPESAGLPLIALAKQADGTCLAATETEGLLQSHDNGIHWKPFGALAEVEQITVLGTTAAGTLLLGTTNAGLVRSVDNGDHWEPVLEETVISYVSEGETLYAGTTQGIQVSTDDGQSWHALSQPPIHDLRQMFVQNKHIYVAGIHTGLFRSRAEQGWEQLADLPYPLTAALPGLEQFLFVASPAGLQRSSDEGVTWQTVIEEANISYLALRADGTGCAGSGYGPELYVTSDGGQSWQQLATPFGALPLSALQVTPDTFIAASYDLRQNAVHVWRSFDNGESWLQELDGQTTWPLVAMQSQPPLLILADAVLAPGQQPGQWSQLGRIEGGIRRIVGNEQNLFVLTTSGIQRSLDGGKSWQADNEGLPVEELLDIAATTQTLYVLLLGGRVWSKSL